MKIKEITENVGKALRGEKSVVPERTRSAPKTKQEIEKKRVEALLTDRNK